MIKLQINCLQLAVVGGSQKCVSSLVTIKVQSGFEFECKIPDMVNKQNWGQLKLGIKRCIWIKTLEKTILLIKYSKDSQLPLMAPIEGSEYL